MKAGVSLSSIGKLNSFSFCLSVFLLFTVHPVLASLFSPFSFFFSLSPGRGMVEFAGKKKRLMKRCFLLWGGMGSRWEKTKE